ncbi:MAG: GNAT family N-acetyltransferase [Proteobacteria bacterium]|jgi:ribosomal protein S18 acetylase RimI-like enzyme|nr:GNAT family N-acetyltransferase [Alphaproteobacteria bacterium]NCC03303.1 GNAT family N-acetyltransferase [Pseudomonadota bacterium]
MIDPKDVSFSEVQESDFEDFKRLRKQVIREHTDRQGLPWDEEAEDVYHRELFDAEGMRAVSFKGQRVGYVGVREDKANDTVVIGRLCIEPDFQNKGIGTQVFEKIFAELQNKGKRFFLDVLLQNYATRLYEQLGFIRVGEDDKLAYYQRSADTHSSKREKSFSKPSLI